jgi:hypothetical protein
MRSYNKRFVHHDYHSQEGWGHLVDQVTGGGRLAGVDVTDHHDVDMDLFLSHGEA